MASTEQPLKKRKLYEPASEPQQVFASPPSHEEIMRKRRNREEIRNVYDCYRRIRFCISQKDAHLMPDFEQAYLSLITASRGCTSAQRIVAELIPRYASYCPTALEAAAKVAVNMYNWSLAVIIRGDDTDGVAFQTAKACSFGLVEICCTAASEAPTSSVIRGICSAVFLNVLTFFVSSFEGKDIYQIGDREIEKIQDSKDSFCEIKQKIADEDETEVSKLFKFRALSLLRIFFLCPKNLLAACFELFISGATDGVCKGHYFLRQVTNQFGVDDVTRPSDQINDDQPCTVSVQTNTEGTAVSSEGLKSDDNHMLENASIVSKNCLMGLVIRKDQPLKAWIFSRYKKLCKSVGSEAVSEISSALGRVFESFIELVEKAESQEDSDEDSSDPSKYISRQYLMPRITSQHDNPGEISRKGSNSRIYDLSVGDAFYEDRESADKVSGRSGKPCGPVVPHGPVSESSNHKCGEPGSTKDLETGERGDSHYDRTSVRKDLVKSQLLSPATRKPLEFTKDAFEGGGHLAHFEKNQVSNMDLGLSAMKSTSGVGITVLSSSKQQFPLRYPSTGQTVWYSDGDPAAMDIYSASQHLWLGCLGPEASETLVRFQIEKFGPIENFFFFPAKGFALVEFRNIMDAIKAHEHMRGSSPWGACLRIKFLDIGLGSRGAISGVAVGASCHVYIGKVSSQWAKDEILHELRKVGFKSPRMVIDLSSESALLMEFETAEEATTVMVHLRQHRKENEYNLQLTRTLTLNAGSDDVARSHMEGARFGPTPIRADFRNTNLGSMAVSMSGSPCVTSVLDSPVDSCKTRMSQLSSLLSSLCTKYNIGQSSSSFESHTFRNHHSLNIRDEDRVPTNTLWIGQPDTGSSFVTDDELTTICNLAVGNVGSVVRLTQANMQMGSCFLVEFSSIDAAIAALKNLRNCPGMFFQAHFSQPGEHHNTPFTVKSGNKTHELVSPRIKLESRGASVQGGHAFQTNWTIPGCAEMLEVGVRKVDNLDGYDSGMTVDHSQADVHAVSNASEQLWMYKKPETELQFSAPGSMPCPPAATQGIVPPPPPPPIQTSMFMRPVYLAPNNSWEKQSMNHPLPLNQISPGIMPNSIHVNAGPAPFLPASVTPLAQISGNSMQFDQMVALPTLPPLSPPPPPPPDMPPPLPPSPPPLPLSQPPLVPPPPSSPPPLPPSVEPSNTENAGQPLQYPWQGALCKSGVHYCTIYAHREDSDVCKYSNAMSEPTEWPVRLDMTKRTDFRHVKSTFSSTPPHKREVCRLLPVTAGDHKGFQDFISYLKQRECAGVIKIPSGKSMWARLLFILPYSTDTCSMFSIAPNPSECLIALVLPKETSFEWNAELVDICSALLVNHPDDIVWVLPFWLMEEVEIASHPKSIGFSQINITPNPAPVDQMPASCCRAYSDGSFTVTGSSGFGLLLFSGSNSFFKARCGPCRAVSAEFAEFFAILECCLAVDR
ncbi:PREDICTED: uncharacterized protein LOC104608162 [Nelumbo nucifera]|uniref:Uncharacterized protein LOC104608162 n=1 Tax=Nelumbo nucifera TaxID=4432 RepID=A0A1U8B7V6_NELNU|nr:PREDICTED: uncharacterized protein LOC104608162 [Nelumbo nucifera]